MFTKSLLFPTHLLLPQLADPTRRYILPLRFFDCFENANQAIAIIQTETGTLVSVPPKQGDFVSAVSAEDLVSIETETVLHWNSQTWPFESNPDQHSSHLLDLTRGNSIVVRSMLAAATIFVALVWLFLPVFVAVVVWLISEYQRFGGFDFFLFQPAISGVMLLPIVLCLALVLMRTFTSAVSSLKLQSAPLKIHLRPEGVHLSNDNFDSWIRATAIKEVIADHTQAGWVVVETDEQVALAKGFFGNEAEFERFRAGVSKLAITKGAAS